MRFDFRKFVQQIASESFDYSLDLHRSRRLRVELLLKFVSLRISRLLVDFLNIFRSTAAFVHIMRIRTLLDEKLDKC